MYEKYESPFGSRYSSKEMNYLFSPDMKFRTWRKLWIALAEAEMELGLKIISMEQIDEMKAFAEDINYDYAREAEKKLKHDVMSHIHAYGEQCKKARPIIHLGATSCYVGDNADLLIYREALKLIKKELLSVLSKLRNFAVMYKNLPTLGYTHLQPAQLVTVGKRAALWMNELLMDYNELYFVMQSLKLRGVKGTTGTQESFLNLFEGDHEKVKALEKKVCEKIGFDEAYPVTGQTFSRKVESSILNVLSQISQSAYKFSNDLRLLQGLKEMEEPFDEDQIGSSAMAYKRNPMRSERISSLARYVIIDALNPAITASTQWLERTLDDSANRRISLPSAFLAADAILLIYNNIVSGLAVHEKIIQKHVMQEIPFMATEKILMEAVKRGGDRQTLHEKIRQLSNTAADAVREGKDNLLISMIASDPGFGLSENDMSAILDPSDYTGRSKEQVEEFVSSYIDPVLSAEKDLIGSVELRV